MVVTSESEKIIRRLYQITNDYQKGFDIQITQLIMMGLERFNLDIGILSRIDGDLYTVLYCVTSEGVELKPGDTFSYGSTYCQITCGSFGPVSIEHMGESNEYAKHPAYEAFGLESYIGIPIFVDDEVFGTLNFSSASPYPRKFKDIDIDVLKLMASWVEVELIRRKQEERLRKLNSQLEYQAYHDALTNIANRRCMFKTIHLDIERMKLASGKGSLGVIDIDHFKKVNDVYGHQIGDDVIKKTAQQLQSCLFESDFIARFGGEEFVVWLPERTELERRQLFEELHQSVHEILLDGVPITVSIGVCEFDFGIESQVDSQKGTLDQLILVADEALYQAKNQGRNRVVTRALEPHK
ncbi:sensor domain-containing diguanylate cyclase [Vibrio neptunius]|uniref:diguanylate cyclase n=1 Tax=Vibrio neptunius TaxID=170651 RepID=A0ABS3A145_9VIBR|nr:sensor domain-containing diguanylate cyclase [Vibrio neptunius]MBN3493198.1 sensor domain-containing diguanylate cyclase [Vibrio neptunius]MBN3515619.1 sensor domain-containing diguanylate cyclase [Vibrio neptunius]MBN3549791.1 sensor domain-containing diguanylate cyclase [Vibrio neptunius]MBN3577924.1 sensor domain-containing diguanylate cyclase [Vibrio neptunius]MCH9871588.1 sensor domain-containing diguanylate cyclase [Vibrio neptunius]